MDASATPEKKRARVFRSSSPPLEGASWTSGAIRILQKDMQNVLALSADLAKRVGACEKDLAQTEQSLHPEPFLQLPLVAPAVLQPTSQSTDLVERVSVIEDSLLRISDKIPRREVDVSAVQESRKTPENLVASDTVDDTLVDLESMLYSCAEGILDKCLRKGSDIASSGVLEKFDMEQSGMIEVELGTLEQELSDVQSWVIHDAAKSLDEMIFKAAHVHDLVTTFNFKVLQERLDNFSEDLKHCFNVIEDERTCGLDGDGLDRKVDSLEKKLGKVSTQVAALSGSEPPPWAQGLFSMVREGRESVEAQFESVVGLIDRLTEKVKRVQGKL